MTLLSVDPTLLPLYHFLPFSPTARLLDRLNMPCILFIFLCIFIHSALYALFTFLFPSQVWPFDFSVVRGVIRPENGNPWHPGGILTIPSDPGDCQFLSIIRPIRSGLSNLLYRSGYIFQLFNEFSTILLHFNVLTWFNLDTWLLHPDKAALQSCREYIQKCSQKDRSNQLIELIDTIKICYELSCKFILQYGAMCGKIELSTGDTKKADRYGNIKSAYPLNQIADTRQY